MSKVAFFMDYDNMLEFLSEASLRSLSRQLFEMGQIEHMVIYTDVTRVVSDHKAQNFLRLAAELGFQVKHCPKLNNNLEKPKDTVDFYILDDVYRLLYQYEEIAIFVFATHDNDFLQAEFSIKKAGKKIIAIMNNQSKNNRRLEQIADQIIWLEPPLPSENPPTPIRIPENLKELLSQTHDSPQVLITAIAESGLADNRELKIALDAVISIDGLREGRYAFNRLMDSLKSFGRFDISGHLFDESIIRGILSSFVEFNIMQKNQEPGFTHYTLNKEHLFVQIALNPEHLESVKALFS